MQTSLSFRGSATARVVSRQRVVLARAQATRLATPVESFALKDGRKVEVYSSKEAASKAVCDSFISAYEEEVKSKGCLTIAIPSGSVVQAIGSLKGHPGIDFSKVHVFFCNERQGGKTFKGDLKEFMEPCGVPLSQCYYIEDWSDPKASAAAYESKMMSSPSNIMRKTSKGAPSLDLILLGTGDDGHCASINPGSDEVKATSGYVLPIPAGDKPGGMTISIFLINAAKRVIVSAAEPKRAGMVKQALTGVFPQYQCPAGLVNTTEGSTVWICDTDSIKSYKSA